MASFYLGLNRNNCVPKSHSLLEELNLYNFRIGYWTIRWHYDLYRDFF